ncbi:uncharacterized protein LOC119288855 isoform X2 [Triticum dicoccoides]|uniref:uncharacterized protein LOC119288855 isoform X2 n=1 Tax=Triticum dicoccoides TaxID=85692 RepID=UPI00188EA47C|nr:uncharacterized protein LOC119288855 isoform X2 [Triticum dicoccoides]
MRVGTRPRRRPCVHGDASSSSSPRGYIRPPRGLPGISSASPHSQKPPQPLLRARDGPEPSHSRLGHHRSPAKFTQSLLPHSVPPPPGEMLNSSGASQLFPLTAGDLLSPVHPWPKPLSAMAFFLLALGFLVARAPPGRVRGVIPSPLVVRAPPGVARGDGASAGLARPRLSVATVARRMMMAGGERRDVVAPTHQRPRGRPRTLLTWNCK